MDYSATGFGEWNVPTVSAEDSATYYELRDSLTADEKKSVRAQAASLSYGVDTARSIELLRQIIAARSVQCGTCGEPVFFEGGEWKHENRNVYCGREHLYKTARPADDVEGCDACSRDLHACRGCGRPISHGAKSCGSCGEREEPECRKCGEPVAPGERECPFHREESELRAQKA